MRQVRRANVQDSSTVVGKKVTVHILQGLYKGIVRVRDELGSVVKQGVLLRIEFGAIQRFDLANGQARRG